MVPPLKTVLGRGDAKCRLYVIKCHSHYYTELYVLWWIWSRSKIFICSNFTIFTVLKHLCICIFYSKIFWSLYNLITTHYCFQVWNSISAGDSGERIKVFIKANQTFLSWSISLMYHKTYWINFQIQAIMSSTLTNIETGCGVQITNPSPTNHSSVFTHMILCQPIRD